jgi:ArsR family transcriptional regulator
VLYASNIDVSQYVRFFKALADRTRLRIVACLSFGELSVNDLVEALAISQPNASRQLGILRNAGIVDQRRAGNFVFYRMAISAIPSRFNDHLLNLVERFKGEHNLRDAIKSLLQRKKHGTRGRKPTS